MSEKESLVDIFQRIYRKHAGKFNDPDPNENGFFEMKKAANEYASRLLPLGNQWKAAVVYDIESINRNGTIPPSIRFNKKRLDNYKLIAGSFLLDIRESLLHHGFDIMELPKETLKYLQRGWPIDIEEKWEHISESQRQQRKAERKPAQASTPATAGSNIQKQPATSTGDTPPQPEETSIFTDCIANDYRDKQAIIEAELRKVINGKKGKAAIIVFVACYIHGILRQCPSHQQALYLSKSIGETKHKGYNDQKKKYFSESEEGKRTKGNTAIYDVLKETMLDTIREAIINAETELKTLFVSLGIVTGDTATDGGYQLTSCK